MAKKGNAKKPPNAQPVSHNKPISLRQESTGKLQTKAKPKSFLKLEQLERLAGWASGEGSVPSLAALFGTQVAAAREALCVPPDPSLFQCQRCETVLQPGFNCTIRIEKTKAHQRRRRRKKPNTQLQNKVIYKCYFCLHQNQKRGTSKGHMKEICLLKAKPSKKAEQPVKLVLQNSASLEEGTSKEDEVLKTAMCTDTSIIESPSTPLLDAMKRTRKRSTSKRPDQPESNSVAAGTPTTIGASRKRKKKSWTSLKEIAESSERGRRENFSNLTIPFIL